MAPDDAEVTDGGEEGAERRERCVLATDGGELLVVELNEVKATHTACERLEGCRLRDSSRRQRVCACAARTGP